MEEEKRYYFLHNDENCEETIPFKLSKKEKDLIEWFLIVGQFDTDRVYLESFAPEDWNEFVG